jgi:hypothetical protein
MNIKLFFIYKMKNSLKIKILNKKMSFECKFCKKNYSTKGSLTNHQKTAKYCIKIQQSLFEVSDIESKSFDCKYCKKSLSSNFNLGKHINLCPAYYQAVVINKDNEILILKENKDNEIKELQDKIASLEQQVLKIELETENRMLREHSKDNQSTINEIAKQPRVATTNNNHNKILINTPMDLSQPTVQLAIQNGFSDEYLVQGQKGVARFAYDNILKDEQGKLKYICTDAARQIFQFKNEDGSIQKDVKATKLTKALLEGELKSASHKMACDKMKDGSVEEFNMYTDNYYDIKDLETDNSDFSKELTTLTA